MSFYEKLLTSSKAKGAAYLVLIDPDKIANEKLPAFMEQSNGGWSGRFPRRRRM